MSKVSRTVLWRTTMLLALGMVATLGVIKMGWATRTVQAQSSQIYNWRNVTINGGGFVPGIIFNTREANLIYARTDIGGAYRWDQSTQSWVPLLDFLGRDDWNLTGVDSLATDPVDPNRLYILAGTYTNEWTNQNGAILRSTDRGNTFQRTMLPFKSGGNMPGRSMGERLSIDPNRNNILYLGARSGNGLWRSTDFGVTWSKVNSFPNPGTYVENPSNSYTADNQGVVWITFDPRTGTPGNATQTIYVGVADKAASVYRSTDGGLTWAAVPGQPTGFLPHHGVLASTGMLYISYSDGGGPYDGGKGDLWRYNTGTASWTNISPVPSSSSDNYFGYGGLSVDAQRPNTLMVAALNSWFPDVQFFRSTDAGVTWTRIWDYAGYPNRTFRYVQDISLAPWLTFNGNPAPPEVAPKLGWMVGSLVIDPFNSDRMMYGTGATIYGTSNLTRWDTGNPVNISVMVKGLEETAVLDLISPPEGAHLLSGLGDINGFRHDDLTVAPTRMFNTPSHTAVSLDYAERSPGFIVRAGNGTSHIGFSFDGGANWFQASTEPGGVSNGGSVAAAADASRVVWSPQGAAVSFSTNNGSSWAPSVGIPSGARILADRVNPLKFYGFANGTLYVSVNGGANFTASGATGLPASAARIKALPGREGHLWLAGETTGLWRSINSGASFTKVGNVQEAYDIGFGRAAPGLSYMALYTSALINGVQGIFRSDDEAVSWVRINDDQHQYGITNSITGDPRVYGRVFFGTNGRGIIQGDIRALSADFSLTANPSSLTINRGTSANSIITITRVDAFPDEITFSASGLPAGVTAQFVPTSTGEAGVTMTLSASLTATAGPATVTVIGSGGGLTRTTTIDLTVNAPVNFALAATPASVSVARGTNATSSIVIDRSSGFTGTVAFTASGVPAGVTATFTPTSTGESGVTLTLAASATATLGPATITVTGTGGGISRTTTIALTVTGGFALTATPASLTIARGASASSTINIARNGGFAATVSFSASGLPAGVTAAFVPASTGEAGVTATFSVALTATTGPATVTVTGTGGGLTVTTTITINVTADFSISPTPAALTITRGTSASSTINILRTGGFSAAVSFSASGLPAGVTAAFVPASTGESGVTLTLTASATAALGTANVTITGTGGGISRTTTIALTVIAPPDFTLAANPASVTVVRGATATSTITITRSGGFAAAVALTASGLPTGVTAAFNPASTTGTSSVVTFTAGANATLGAATVTITGTGGALTRTTTIALTVNPAANFTLAANPATLAVNRGANAASTVTITRVGGFAAAVAFTASGLPTGVTAAFNPASTTGTSSVVTFTAGANATLGAATVTITGTGGGLTRTTTIALTVNAAGTGGVTITPVVSTNGPFFNQEDVVVANTAPITAMTITVVLQQTPGLRFTGMFNTVGGTILQTNSNTATTFTAVFTLAAGATLPAGSWTFATQTGASGTTHVTAGDTFTVTYTTGGQTFTQTGHF